MTRIKHGLAFVLGIIYISLLWFAITIQEEAIKAVFAYIFAIASILVITAIGVFLGDNWKND